MKRILALFFLILLCSQPVFAARQDQYLGQFYDGEAKPRAEVAWIWLRTPSLSFTKNNSDTKVSIHKIDNLPIKMKSRPPDDMAWMRALEVLPGTHIISVSVSGNGYSLKDIEVQIDAKTGENYFVDADITSRKHSRSELSWTWRPTIEVAPFVWTGFSGF